MERVSIEDKARLLAGASHWRTYGDERLGVVALTLSDGPHGLRKQEGSSDHLGIAESVPATCFPSAAALACSFDPDLIEEVGAALGEETADQGVDVVLGPGVNIKRHPLCGRNFEYFSEDPVVSGEMGAAMVRGIQSRGVGACLKHFAGNSQEHARMVADSVIDERALRELYLAPFEHVVKSAHPCTIMTAYNRLNGEYCSQNRWLLQDVLRDEWGFDGVTVSDWGAMSSSVTSVHAGLDLCMPGPRRDHASAIAEAVRSGELGEEDLDERVEALARLTSRIKPECPPVATADKEAFYRSHADLARRAAAQSAVLLKNDGTLPLNTTQTVAVIGAFARLPRYQGSGSSRINPKFLDNIWYRIEQRGFAATYADGYEPQMGETNEQLLAEAERVASDADVAVVVAGLPARYESEGFDRKLMVMPRGHVELIERVCAANPRTVVVLQGGAPMEMSWRDKPAAILLMYLSGCQGGGAAVDVLAGDVNPSGKLAETWPQRLADTALGSTFPDMDREVHYRESVFVGYRYYDAVGVDPAFPFGFGLSYTQFEYRNLEVNHGRVRLQVKNTGVRAGADVVQLYMAPSAGVVPPPRPPQRLVAFCKVHVEPGEERAVEFSLGMEAVRSWDASAHEWVVCAGAYELRASASSRDVRLCLQVEVLEDGVVEAAGCEPPRAGLNFPQHERLIAVPSIYEKPHAGCFAEPEAESAFTQLYGSELPEPRPVVPFTVDSTVEDMAASWFGRRMFRIIDWVVAEPSSKMDHIQRTMMREMAADMPLRSLTTSGVPLGAVEGFVGMLNGHYLTGFAWVVRELTRAIFSTR